MNRENLMQIALVLLLVVLGYSLMKSNTSCGCRNEHFGNPHPAKFGNQYISGEPNYSSCSYLALQKSKGSEFPRVGDNYVPGDIEAAYEEREKHVYSDNPIRNYY